MILQLFKVHERRKKKKKTVCTTNSENRCFVMFGVDNAFRSETFFFLPFEVGRKNDSIYLESIIENIENLMIKKYYGNQKLNNVINVY